MLRCATVFVCLAATLTLLLCPALAQAQYFGRNKVQYEHFKFEILHTPHFDLHYYAAEKQGAVVAATCGVGDLAIDFTR